MVKELVHDNNFLSQESEIATEKDLQTATDLLDTLIHHRETCVGMAANMIGIKKRIICFDNDGEYMTMFNPIIIKHYELYETTESCLSYIGEAQKVFRYKKIRVQFQNQDFKTKSKTFVGFTSQIIQHEIDHCEGILV